MVGASNHRRPSSKMCSFQVRRVWCVQADGMGSVCPLSPPLGGRIEKKNHASDILNMSYYVVGMLAPGPLDSYSFDSFMVPRVKH